MEQKIFFKKLLWLIYKEMCIMYDLIHCYDVLHLLFCLPIHK